MKRKRLLVLLLILFITLCSSCKKQNSDFVDISFNFENHLKETYPFIGQHVQIKLFEKSQLKNSQYKELYNKYSHLVGGIIMFVAHTIPVFNYLPDSQVYLVMYIGALICTITGYMRNILVALSSNISYSFKFQTTE